ncbi:MAG TPA: HWE histidine kinase domain-containing protein [Caulobacteraceae bacterium]
MGHLTAVEDGAEPPLGVLGKGATRVRIADPVRDGGGKVRRLERSRAEFQARELLHRDLLNALPAAIYTIDTAGRITFYNEAAVALAGRRPVLGSDEWCVTWKLYNPDGSPLPHDVCPTAIALKEGRSIRGVEAIAERPDGSRVWFMPYPTPLKDETGAIVGAVNMLVDITARKAAEARQTLLANEVNHRANNLLAVVQASLRMTQADTVEGFRAAMMGRVGALAHAHSLLARSRWTGADLERLVAHELGSYMDPRAPRVRAVGPATPLRPTEAQSMAMALHELATNAAKYGALALEAGGVVVEWARRRDRLVVCWREEGGPRAKAPAREGVGGRVIRVAMAQLGGGVSFDWRPEGLHCELSLPLAPAI